MAEGLIYVNDSQGGYGRRKHGRGFIYFDHLGKKVSEKKVLEYLRSLRIPPAWQEVWISRHQNGYLLATGKDEKGRKQYIYHPRWKEMSRHEKFSRLLQFGKSLPAIRKKVERDLEYKQWSHEKMLALVVKLMDEKYLRIGNPKYEAENHTYGATTIRRKHLDEEGDGIRIEYKAKSGKIRKIRIHDPELVKLVKESSELPGYKIFSYPAPGGKSGSISSHDVSAYLEETTGRDFTSKTFRTWGGTVLALKEWNGAREEIAGSRKSFLPTLIKRVARQLGNTAPVTKEYYIHPLILDKISEEKFDPEKIEIKNLTAEAGKYLDEDEQKVITLLEENG